MGTANLKAMAGVTDTAMVNIKQASIELHQRLDVPSQDAANGAFLDAIANEAHVEAVKRWLKEQEREFAIKVDVLAGGESLDGEGVELHGAAGLLNNKPFMLANGIHSHKQAMDVYEYALTGLLFLPAYLGGNKDLVCAQIYRDLSVPQRDYLSRTYGLRPENADAITPAVMQYLAHLSHLSVKPTCLQRREGFQRSWLRKVYSKLEWCSEDIHYLLYRAKKSGINAAKKQR